MEANPTNTNECKNGRWKEKEGSGKRSQPTKTQEEISPTNLGLESPTERRSAARNPPTRPQRGGN